MSQLEKYLQFSSGITNEALTPQLQALAEGRDIEELARAGQGPIPVQTAVGTELTDDDREELRRWSLEHGYRIYFQLLDNWIQAQEDGARQASIEDPLGNQSELSKLWAYVAMQRRVRIAMEAMIQAEIAKLH